MRNIEEVSVENSAEAENELEQRAIEKRLNRRAQANRVSMFFGLAAAAVGMQQLLPSTAEAQNLHEEVTDAGYPAQLREAQIQFQAAFLGTESLDRLERSGPATLALRYGPPIETGEQRLFRTPSRQPQRTEALPDTTLLSSGNSGLEQLPEVAAAGDDLYVRDQRMFLAATNTHPSPAEDPAHPTNFRTAFERIAGYRLTNTTRRDLLIAHDSSHLSVSAAHPTREGALREAFVTALHQLNPTTVQQTVTPDQEGAAFSMRNERITVVLSNIHIEIIPNEQRTLWSAQISADAHPATVREEEEPRHHGRGRRHQE